MAGVSEGLVMSASTTLQDYNFRTYALRRIKTGFHENQGLAGEKAQVEFQKGLEQLGVLKR
jgi:hypothetical protein